MRGPRRLTYRARLTATYAALVAGAGLLMMATLIVIVSVIPQFAVRAFDATSAVDPSSGLPSMPTIVPNGPGSDAIDLGADDMAVEEVYVSVDTVVQIVWIGGGIMLVVLVIAGALVSRTIAGRMLRPLQEVGDAAREAGGGRLDHRIGWGAPRDEITALASTFDDMLDNLEGAFHAHRRFAANASHELRTPLATSRAALDVALSSSDPSQRAVLEGLRDMNERSVETVEALLLLSDVEAATRSFDVVDVARTVRDVMAEHSISAASHAHLEPVRQTHDDQPFLALGDMRLMRVLIDNLVRNAREHNIDDGFVRVTLDHAARTVTVENSGPVLDDDELARLREPFGRSSGRVRDGRRRGHGLGLSIIDAIADLHEVTVILQARADGGVRAVVTFPPLADDEAATSLIGGTSVVDETSA